MKNSANLSKFKEKCKFIFSTNKKKNILLLLGLFIGIVLLVLSFFIPKKTDVQKEQNKVESISNYSATLETKLENMLLNLEDIKTVSVMVMVDSTPKIEYLTETEQEIKSNEKESSSTTSTTVVFEKDGSVSTPVVVTTIMPKVTGVLIVLNKISPSTKISIINSISVVLNIDSSCISILQES